MCIYEAEKQLWNFMCPWKDKIFREEHVPASINSKPRACNNNNKYALVKDNYKFVIDFDHYSTLNNCRVQQSHNDDIDK